MSEPIPLPDFLQGVETGLTPLTEATAMSGLDFLRGMMAGRFPAPPVCATAQILLSEADRGRVVFVGRPQAAFFNPLGTVHGGWTATIMDSAMACAAHTMLAPGQGYTTIEFKITCLRPVMPSDTLVRCEGTVVNAGRRVIATEGRLFDSAGKLLAHGTETCLVMDMPAGG